MTMARLGKFLVRKGNEMQWRISLDGLDDGWELLGEGAAFEPKLYHDWDDKDKKWVANPVAEEKGERDKLATNMTQAQLVEKLMDEIEELRTRLFILEQAAQIK